MPKSKISLNDKKWRYLILFLLLIPYVLYLFFIVKMDQGPIDYETFMRIGENFSTGKSVYGENSYYPYPYVIIFSFFQWMPRSLSMVLWMGIPVLAGLIITEFNPMVLLFAPLAAHFLGGQTAVFAMIGLWGYRRNLSPDQVFGGMWLALMTIKPQLAVFSCFWAGFFWVQHFLQKKRLPFQFFSFICTILLIYLPSFFINPNWVAQWLATPRPLFERALSGFVPRTLLLLISYESNIYWILLLIIAILFFSLIWHLNQKSFTYDLFILASFVINPLVHDYDLIQIISIVKENKLFLWALLVSIPGWITILFFYGVDYAWYVFTFIAPVVLIGYLTRKKQENN